MEKKSQEWGGGGLIQSLSLKRVIALKWDTFKLSDENNVESDGLEWIRHGHRGRHTPKPLT